MPKTSDAIRSAVNRERIRNMKSMCLYCRNGEAVEMMKSPITNIAYWVHGNPLNHCAAGPIRDRAMKYGPERRPADSSRAQSGSKG